MSNPLRGLLQLSKHCGVDIFLAHFSTMNLEYVIVNNIRHCFSIVNVSHGIPSYLVCTFKMQNWIKWCSDLRHVSGMPSSGHITGDVFLSMLNAAASSLLKCLCLIKAQVVHLIHYIIMKYYRCKCKA